MTAHFEARDKRRKTVVPNSINLENADCSVTEVPETIKFQNPNHLHFVNCVLYVDFETRFHQIEPEQVAKQIRRLGSSCNAISVGWHAVGRDGFEEVLKKRKLQPLRHGLIRADGSADDAYIAEKAVLKWLQLAE